MREPAKIVAFGEYELDFGRGELRHQEQSVDIQPTPLRLLFYLAEHRDRVVPRAELLDAIWPGVVVGDEALTTALGEARHAVGDDGATQCAIRTYKGRGYRFVAGIRGASAPPPGTAPGLSRRARVRRIASVALIAAATTAVLVLRQRAIHRIDAEVERVRSVAVLPLTNGSGDPAQDLFASAMTDVLIVELARLPELRVLSHSSVLKLGAASQSPRALLTEFGMDAVIEGSVVSDRGRVRISVHLVGVPTGRQLWTESYERETSHVLEIQGEVARAVATEIHLALSPERARGLARDRVLSADAQDAYFRGLLQNTRFDFESMRGAIDAFARAAVLAPAYAPAHAQLAASYVRFAVYGQPDSETWIRARRAASRAIELDESLGDAHFTLATIQMLERDWTAAEASFRRGIELGVGDPTILGAYAFYLLSMNRPREAIDWMDGVAARAPLDSFVRVQRVRVLTLAGNSVSALEEIDRILAAEEPRDAQIYALRLFADENLGRYEDAIGDLRKFVETDGDRSRLAFLDEVERAYRANGRTGYWRAWALRSGRNPLRAATAHAQLGDLDAAFSELERAWAARSATEGDVYFARTMTGLAPLRGDQRFNAFVRRFDLPPE